MFITTELPGQRIQGLKKTTRVPLNGIPLQGMQRSMTSVSLPCLSISQKSRVRKCIFTHNISFIFQGTLWKFILVVEYTKLWLSFAFLKQISRNLYRGILILQPGCSGYIQSAFRFVDRSQKRLTVSFQVQFPAPREKKGDWACQLEDYRQIVYPYSHAPSGPPSSSPTLIPHSWF